MGDLDKLWSNLGAKRLKTDQDLPVFMVRRIFLVGWGAGSTARKTATTGAKTTNNISSSSINSNRVTATSTVSIN